MIDLSWLVSAVGTRFAIFDLVCRPDCEPIAMFRHALFLTAILSAHPTIFAQSPANPVTANVQRLHSTNAVDRSEAAKALGALGESAGPAAPQLIQALGDRDPFVAREATNALCLIGHGAVAPLVRALEGSDPGLRHHAAIALSRIGPTGPAAIKALVKALKDDPSAEVRRRAALALDKCGKASAGVVTGLVAALKDRDPTVRLTAAMALGNLGAEAKDAAGPLTGLLMDDDAKLRTAAGTALQKITGAKRP